MRTLANRTGVAALAVVLAGSACGNTDDASLCVTYGEYLTVVQPVLDADPTAASAAEATIAVEDVLASVRQLREVTEGRYAAPVEALEAALDDLRRTLASVDGEADYGTWEPLVADSIDDANDAAARVADEIDPVCRPGS